MSTFVVPLISSPRTSPPPFSSHLTWFHLKIPDLSLCTSSHLISSTACNPPWNIAEAEQTDICNQLSWHGRQTCVDCRRSFHTSLPASGSFFRSGWTSRSFPSLSNQPMSKSYAKEHAMPLWTGGYKNPLSYLKRMMTNDLEGKLWQANDLYSRKQCKYECISSLVLLRCVLHDITDVPRILSLVMKQ